MNRLIASLYSAQCSEIAAFKFVYRGSRSIRGIEFEGFVAFGAGCADVPFALDASEDDVGG